MGLPIQAKIARINLMMNEEHNTPPETQPAVDDDLRFAPPAVDEASEDDANTAPENAETAELLLEAEDVPGAVTDDMDIEAALAAVSTLSDMLAEREAAVQAQLAREEAERQAAEERRARMEHPELFFPVPPMQILHRGQMASVIPALVLIGLGAWLTFSLTTRTALNTGLIVAIMLGGLALIWLARWLSSGRWARGSLFFALAGLLGAGSLFYLLQPASPGLAGGWPLLLIALGTAYILAGVLAAPRDGRLLLPGFLFVAAGAAALSVTLGLLGGEIISTAAALWPAALIAVVLIWLLPVLFRRRG